MNTNTSGIKMSLVALVLAIAYACGSSDAEKAISTAKFQKCRTETVLKLHMLGVPEKIEELARKISQLNPSKPELTDTQQIYKLPYLVPHFSVLDEEFMLDSCFQFQHDVDKMVDSAQCEGSNVGSFLVVKSEGFYFDPLSDATDEYIMALNACTHLRKNTIDTPDREDQ